MKKLLAIYYTHNQINQQLLEASVKSVIRATDYANLKGRIQVSRAITSWEKVEAWKGGMIYQSIHKKKGHMNICWQLLKVLSANEGMFDYVTFCEHDVLYAPNYFDRISEYLVDDPEYVVNLNYIGLGPTGYVRPQPVDRCLSQATMRYDFAIANLERSKADCERQGWCYLEPDQPATYMTGDDAVANVHVNMNTTGSSHHLTNHYDLYERIPYIKHHPLWGLNTQHQFFAPVA
jgi:hypothetical protein